MVFGFIWLRPQAALVNGKPKATAWQSRVDAVAYGLPLNEFGCGRRPGGRKIRAEEWEPCRTFSCPNFPATFFLATPSGDIETSSSVFRLEGSNAACDRNQSRLGLRPDRVATESQPTKTRGTAASANMGLAAASAKQTGQVLWLLVIETRREMV
jgi:hypothetical protein